MNEQIEEQATQKQKLDDRIAELEREIDEFKKFMDEVICPKRGIYDRKHFATPTLSFWVYSE